MDSLNLDRRGVGLGCIILVLGLVLSCCLTPYLMSSMYSIVTAVLNVPGTPGWLWGNLLNEAVESDSAIYMLMAEGPICCVGSMGLLILILGIVMLVTSLGGSDDGSDDEGPSAHEPPPPDYPGASPYPDQYVPVPQQYPQPQQVPQQPPQYPPPTQYPAGTQYPTGTEQAQPQYPSQPQDPYYRPPPEQYR